MVLVFMLGILDIIAGLALAFLKLFPILKIPVLIISVLIIFKAVKYAIDISSVIDFIAAFIMVLAVLGYSNIFTYLMVVWFLQKGIRSFM